MFRKYTVLTEYILSNQHKFYRVAYSFCKSNDDALNIVQDSIYKALKSYKSIQSEQYLKTYFIGF